MTASLNVTVLIPTYNRAHFLPRALRSALDNIEAGDEILVVDDSSTDNTEEVMQGYGQPVRYLKVSHGGAGATRNKGVRAAAKSLIAFLDSDDEWFPGKLKLMRQVLEKRPDVLFCFSDFAGRCEERVDHHYLVNWHKDPRSWDEILGPGIPYTSLAPLPTGWSDFSVHIGSIYLGEMLSDYVATTTTVTRRLEAGDALVFAEDLIISEDKECFGRLAGKGLAAYLDVETSFQYEHPGPRLTDFKVVDLAQARITIMERLWRQDPGFMQEHGDDYFAKKTQQHLLKARCLIVSGRLAEARQELKQAGHSPLAYRLLASLPSPVVKGLLGMKRLLVGRGS